jgi:hypothetical protein
MGENNMMGLEKELEDLINRYSLESGSNTPDFILAEYLIACLRTFNVVMYKRDNWWHNPSKVKTIGKVFKGLKR